ncbi:MAG: caspase family protein, partial [Saprospiraceae bacterium]|nr:caspase family protein [Saprospiraceae bacterium]
MPTETSDLSHWGKSGSGTSWFMGIGINDYGHFPRLRNAVKDMADVKSVLCEKYDISQDHILTLVNEEANEDNIIMNFEKLARETKPEDKVIIFYSGHGHLNKLNPKNNLGYWIPIDGQPGRSSTFIPNSTIKNYIGAITARHILLISDSCFSGSLFSKGASRSTRAMDELESIPSRWALCSGRHDEEVYDGAPGSNSPFTKSLLDVLSSNQRD